MPPAVHHHYLALGASTLLAFLCFAGCAYRATTEEEREASFAPFEDRRVSGTSLREAILLRSAVIVAAEDLAAEQADDGSAEGLVLRGDGAPPIFGSAAAIDRRGYFLTAAHCLTAGPAYLLVPTPEGSFHTKRARVVWQGRAPAADLAILHIDSPRERVFRWATEIDVEGPVFGCGPSMQADGAGGLNIAVGPFAGKLIAVSPAVEHAGLTHQIVDHTAPLHLGDSGGPLTDANGRLIGINVSLSRSISLGLVRPIVETGQAAQAIRPDPSWIRQVIEADHARRR